MNDRARVEDGIWLPISTGQESPANRVFRTSTECVTCRIIRADYRTRSTLGPPPLLGGQVTFLRDTTSASLTPSLACSVVRPLPAVLRRRQRVGPAGNDPASPGLQSGANPSQLGTHGGSDGTRTRVYSLCRRAASRSLTLPGCLVGIEPTLPETQSGVLPLDDRHRALREIRTPDLQVRSLLLYSAELVGRV